ncbi:MAG TPA: ABC transporter ATP-binding protein [Candidatus Sumerlaeia bacterium]|nr:ABC transporter ATP-binding protein [Candidatus Sumerlaeia bacterium]
MLKVQNIRAGYGNLLVLKNASIHINEGEIVTLIGPNGCGKSTLLKTIVRLLPLQHGSIMFQGKEINHLPPEKTVSLGIALVPEGRHIFAPLSVMDNLLLGAYTCFNKLTFQEDLERMFVLFPRLKERRKQLAGTLSGGEQQMLAIARALMSRPRLLLLDEPSMGLAPLIVENIFETINKLRAEGKTTICLVEQNAEMALEISDRGYVLETGKIVYQGPRENLIENVEVIRAYLG